MSDCNINIDSFSEVDGIMSIKLVSGEVLKSVTSYVRLYAWVNDTDIVYTTVPNPTTNNQALIGFTASDVVDIEAVEGDTIIVLDEVYTRAASTSDIELD